MRPTRPVSSSLLCALFTILGLAFLGGRAAAAGELPAVTLYEDAGFKGDSVTFDHSIRDLGQFAFNDTASSMKISGGILVAAYADIDFGGSCEPYFGFDTHLADNRIGNDRISSVKVGASCAGPVADPVITDLRVINGSVADIVCPRGYVKRDRDLNQGVGGDFIFACLRFEEKTAATDPIIDLEIASYDKLTAAASPPRDECEARGGVFIDTNLEEGVDDNNHNILQHFCYYRSSSGHEPERIVRDIAFSYRELGDGKTDAEECPKQFADEWSNSEPYWDGLEFVVPQDHIVFDVEAFGPETVFHSPTANLNGWKGSPGIFPCLLHYDPIPDNAAPVMELIGVTPDASNGWRTGDVTVTWSCTDPQAGSAYREVAEVVTGEGRGLEATGTCTDAGGRTASRVEGGINIDRTPPDADIRVPAANGSYVVGQQATVDFGCADALSGVASCEGSFADGTALPTTTPGSYVFTVFMQDGAGNATCSCFSHPWSVVKAGTTVAVSTTPAATVLNDAASVTARVAVAAPGSGTPAGTVTFTDGGSLLGTAAVAADGSATLSTSFATTGTHTITASYGGDDRFLPSDGTAVHTVHGYPTTTSITSSAQPASYGQQIVFSIAVTAASGVPAGTVHLAENDATLGSAVLAGGKATIALDGLATGNHILIARYDGNDTFGASAADIGQQVDKGHVTTDLASSAATTAHGQSVTFTATVTPIAPAAGTPTGTVTFLVDGATVAQRMLTDGRATMTTSALAAGSHDVQASYGGSGNHFGADGFLRHTVEKVATTATLTSSTPNPSVYGEALRLTVTVTSASGAVPAGSVALMEGGRTVATSSLGNGKAAFNVVDAELHTGTHTLTAVYAGNANFLPPASAPALVQQVEKAGVIMAVFDQTEPVAFGEELTILAAIATQSPGQLRAPGSLRFETGGRILADVPLQEGLARYRTASLPAGDWPISVSYAGSDDFLSGRSDPVVFRVDKAPTTLALSSEPSPSVFGQDVRLNVVASSTAGAPPGGTVIFSDGGTAIGTVDLAPSGTTLTVPDLPAGTRALTATFSGTSDFAGSSAALEHTVDRAPASVSVSAEPGRTVYGQEVTVRAAVAPPYTGGGHPTGEVTFLAGDVVLGSVPVTYGAATLTTAAVDAGDRPVRADYGGSDNHLPGSGSVRLVVDRAGVAVDLSTTTDTSTYGEPVGLSVAVAAVAPGGGTPSGDVVLTDAGREIGRATLSDGTASITTTTLGAGTHAIAASFAGGANHLPGTSDARTVEVAKATLTVEADDLTTTYGAEVPSATWTISGFRNGETIATSGVSGTPSCSAAASETSPVGTYAIACTLGTLDAANYGIAFEDGMLMVRPAPLAVHVADATVQYSDPLPAPAATYDGFVLGEGPEVLDGGCSTDAAQGSPAGTYPMTCSYTSPNYEITSVAGTLTITPEDAAVRFDGGTPEAVPVTSRGGSAPSMTFSSTITEARDGSYGDPRLAQPATYTLTPVGEGSTFTCSATAARVLPATPGSPGSIASSCTFPAGVPVNLYRLTVTAGGSYAGSATSLLSVYDRSAGPADATGTVVDPATGATGVFSFSLRYVPAGNVQGRFTYSEPQGGRTVRGTVMSTMAVPGRTAKATGSAVVDGAGNHRFVLIGIDGDGTGRPDAFGLQVTGPSGEHVLRFDPVALSSGDVKVQG